MVCVRGLIGRLGTDFLTPIFTIQNIKFGIVKTFVSFDRNQMFKQTCLLNKKMLWIDINVVNKVQACD
jgi:hypothetical protein